MGTHITPCVHIVSYTGHSSFSMLHAEKLQNQYKMQCGLVCEAIRLHYVHLHNNCLLELVIGCLCVCLRVLGQYTEVAERGDTLPAVHFQEDKGPSVYIIREVTPSN